MNQLKKNSKVKPKKKTNLIGKQRDKKGEKKMERNKLIIILSLVALILIGAGVVVHSRTNNTEVAE